MRNAGACPASKVVEHLQGRRIPVRPVRRLGRAGPACRARAAAAGTSAARCAGQAEVDEGCAELLSRGRSGRRDMRINLAQWRLRENSGAEQRGRECGNHDGLRVTRSSLFVRRCAGSRSRLPASVCSRPREPCAENGAFVGSASIFCRSRETARSTERVVLVSRKPQTSLKSSSRNTTRDRRSASTRRISNSRWVRCRSPRGPVAVPLRKSIVTSASLMPVMVGFDPGAARY